MNTINTFSIKPLIDGDKRPPRMKLLSTSSYLSFVVIFKENKQTLIPGVTLAGAITNAQKWEKSV